MFAAFLLSFLTPLAACTVRSERLSDCPPNYWCTWATQGSQLGRSIAGGKLDFPGDQGRPGQRDNLNEAVLFGQDGWAVSDWEGARKDLYLMLDDGWDVPYGAKNVKGAPSPFGSCVPDAWRFPSLSGPPEARLKALNDKVRRLGWRGLALWVACQTPGEANGSPFPDERSRAAWAERMRISRAAGIGYWKVDWGMHSGSAAYREMMARVRDRVHPDLIIEHCMPSWPLDDGSRDTNRTDRVLAASDVFRTYDTLGPLATATTLSRIAWLSGRADAHGLQTMLNVEDEPMIAAALGHLMGVMRRSDSDGARETVEAALAWQRLAPPFGHDRGLRTLVSEKELEDSWFFRPGATWYKAADGKTVAQKAPAVLVRGLPLPRVSGEGTRPFVCGARFPNGALALAFLPRTVDGRRKVTGCASVEVDVSLEPERPLAIFGAFGSVVLKGGAAPGLRIFARRLPDGEARDVTDLCTRGTDAVLTIPSDVQDRSFACPNVVIEGRKKGR